YRLAGPEGERLASDGDLQLAQWPASLLSPALRLPTWRRWSVTFRARLARGQAESLTVAPALIATFTSACLATSSAAYFSSSIFSARSSSAFISTSRSLSAAPSTPRSANACLTFGPHSPMSRTHGTILLNSSPRNACCTGDL